jgi:hypothetical protein
MVSAISKFMKSIMDFFNSLAVPEQTDNPDKIVDTMDGRLIIRPDFIVTKNITVADIFNCLLSLYHQQVFRFSPHVQCHSSPVFSLAGL